MCGFSRGVWASFSALDLRGVQAIVVATDNLGAELDAGQIAASLGIPLIRAGRSRAHWNRAGRRPCGRGKGRLLPGMHVQRRRVGAPEQSGRAFLLGRISRCGCFRLPAHHGHAGAVFTGRVARRDGAPAARLGPGQAARRPIDQLQRLYAIDHATPLWKDEWTVRASMRPFASRQRENHFSLCTPMEMIKRGGGRAAIGQATLEVQGHTWVEAIHCCGSIRPVGRFVSSGAGVPCPVCGQPVLPTPFYEYPRVRSAVLGRSADMSFATIGAGQARWVIVRGPRGAVLLHEEDEP